MDRGARALRALLSLLIGALFVLVGAAAAEANTITVNVTDDPAGAGGCLNGGTCSLRQAVGAASSGDEIVLGPHVYTLTQGTNLDITQPIALVGDQVGTTSIDGSQNVSNGAQNRILRIDVAAPAVVTIENLTFTGGFDGKDENCCNPVFNLNGGGAIFNASGSTLMLQDVAFRDNPGGILGGAIANNGTLKMQDVSFTDDQGNFGGALFSRGAVTATGVTFEADATGPTDEAAVYLLGGTANFTNTTVVGSGGASSRGGGIHNAGAALTLTNATLSDNIRGSLLTDQGAASTSVANTIIADGFSDGDGDCVAANLASGNGTTANAITTDLGGNLDQDDSCGFTAANGDKPGVDPKLASIADNGGPTRTEALVFGSPAFASGNDANCPQVDQRDQPRAQPCDIGAFEAQFTQHQPVAVTATAVNIQQTQADLRGNIDFAGEAGGLHFLWGTSADALTNTSSEAGEGVIDGATLKSQTLQNLAPGTTYFYRAVADNATGSATSTVVQQFTTDPGPPVVSSISLGRVTDTTATIDFSINPQGSGTSYLVAYGPDTNYGQHTQPVDIGSATGDQPLAAVLTGLTPGATYHVAVFASNAVQQDVTSFDQTFATERQLHGTAGTPLELDDSNADASDCPSQATVDWGDGNTDTGVPVQCNFPGDDENPASYSLSARHTYTAPDHYPILIAYDNGDRSNLFAQVSAPQTQPPPTGNAPAPAPPGVTGGAPTSETSRGASVSGSVNPEGVATQAFFQYGLDVSQRGPGASTVLYDQSTPVQQVGSDSSSHTVSALLTGLLPGALYHVRLVAVNAAGTTFGQDQTFTTAAAAAPAPPVLGHSEDVKPVSGIVFIKTPGGQFIPLTGATQIPTGSVIDALHGSLQIVAAVGKGKTQHGIFGGAIFKLTQARNTLTTLLLLEGAFNGAPSYAICKAHKAADATAAALSSKTLQLLHANAHGKFRTTGRYSAATVRGTIWTVADRCDGTLTHVVTDSVVVQDFVHHKTTILHAGQSYLARARR